MENETTLPTRLSAIMLCQRGFFRRFGVRRTVKVGGGPQFAPGGRLLAGQFSSILNQLQELQLSPTG